MHPDKQKSFFKIVFSQSWTVSGYFKKFFRVLLHGRSLVIKFNRPLTLSELKDKERGLMLPHIAAGNNLNLPILGGIGKGGGAFFMRRSFRDNKLYSLIFFQYFKRLLQRGSSVEFFPEGGRSRSGFTLQAKPGLLSMTIRSFASLSDEKVKLIPTYIGYEKIIEGNSYLSELLGEENK